MKEKEKSKPSALAIAQSVLRKFADLPEPEKRYVLNVIGINYPNLIRSAAEQAPQPSEKEN